MGLKHLEGELQLSEVAGRVCGVEPRRKLAVLLADRAPRRDLCHKGGLEGERQERQE